MSDVNEDVKESIEASPDAAGGASAPEQTPSDFLIDVDDIVQSQLDTDPGEAKNTQESEEGDKGKSDEEAKVKEEAEKKAAEEKAVQEAEKPSDIEDDEIDEDKHPRFKKRIDKLTGQNSEYLERALKAEGKLEAFAETRGNQEGTADTQIEASPVANIKFDDVLAMTDEDIQDKLADNPKSFLANFANQVAVETYQIIHGEINADKEKGRQADLKTSVQGTYDQYAKDNPDFNAMWDSGEIKSFMDKNPGHNAISAHQTLIASKSKDGVQKMVDDAVAKAKKETEAKVLKDVKAKRNASVISGGPTSGGQLHDVSQELKDPKKFGGASTVLANRLAERRRAANAM